MLFVAWQGHLHRPTRDLDLLGYGPSEPLEIAAGFREICEVEADDGITFHADSIVATIIKEDGDYEGVRLNFTAELAGARIAVQIDIGFGDESYRFLSIIRPSFQSTRRSYEPIRRKRSSRRNWKRW